MQTLQISRCSLRVGGIARWIRVRWPVSLYVRICASKDVCIMHCVTVTSLLGTLVGHSISIHPSVRSLCNYNVQAYSCDAPVGSAIASTQMAYTAVAAMLTPALKIFDITSTMCALIAKAQRKHQAKLQATAAQECAVCPEDIRQHSRTCCTP